MAFDLKIQKRNLKLRDNLIDIFVHCLVTIIFVFIIYTKSANIHYAIVFLLGNVFIDLDHLIDHFLYSKNKFNLRDFLSSNHLEAGRLYLFFHSWELNIALFILALVFRSVELLLLSAAVTIHLVTDIIIHKKILPYFMAFRIVKKFDAKIFEKLGTAPIFTRINRR